MQQSMAGHDLAWTLERYPAPELQAQKQSIENIGRNQ